MRGCATKKKNSAEDSSKNQKALLPIHFNGPRQFCIGESSYFGCCSLQLQLQQPVRYWPKQQTCRICQSPSWYVINKKAIGPKHSTEKPGENWHHYSFTKLLQCIYESETYISAKNKKLLSVITLHGWTGNKFLHWCKVSFSVGGTKAPTVI